MALGLGDGLGDGLAGSPMTGTSGGGIEPLAEQMDRIEKQLIEDALARCGGRVGETADKLGITRKTLYLKMRHHGTVTRTEPPRG